MKCLLLPQASYFISVSSLLQWDTIQFTVTTEKDFSTGKKIVSYPGTVTLVPPSGALVGSNFLLDNNGWTISGNKQASSPASYEPYTRGVLLNHYVTGADDKINVPYSGAADQSLWYFEAPSKFLGNWGISYGGELQFTLGSFSGDFSSLNGKQVCDMHSLHCFIFI